VNEDGVLTGEYDTIAMCGFVRRKGLGDDAFYRIAKKKGYFTPSGKTPTTSAD
jgi:Ribosomal protein S21e